MNITNTVDAALYQVFTGVFVCAAIKAGKRREFWNYIVVPLSSFVLMNNGYLMTRL